MGKIDTFGSRELFGLITGHNISVPCNLFKSSPYQWQQTAWDGDLPMLPNVKLADYSLSLFLSMDRCSYKQSHHPHWLPLTSSAKALPARRDRDSPDLLFLFQADLSPVTSWLSPRLGEAVPLWAAAPKETLQRVKIGHTGC